MRSSFDDLNRLVDGVMRVPWLTSCYGFVCAARPSTVKQRMILVLMLVMLWNALIQGYSVALREVHIFNELTRGVIVYRTCRPCLDAGRRRGESSDAARFMPRCVWATYSAWFPATARFWLRPRYGVAERARMVSVSKPSGQVT